MIRKEELLEIYNGEYKIGILGRKNKVVLYVYEKRIKGTAAGYSEGKFYEYMFDIAYEHIKKIEKRFVEGIQCIEIEYANTNTVIKNNITTIYLPNIEKVENVIECLEKRRQQIMDEYLEIEKRELEQKEQRLLEEQKLNEERQCFFNKCYDFHIKNDSNPYYELQKDELLFVCVYVDKKKNMNFLRIDGIKQEESNGYVPYEKIHYYDKAGSIHYTTDINGEYSSFGGSISGGTVSKRAALLGGLLFGPMGMAYGALHTHKPMEVKLPTSTFDVSSQVKKVDDRSVILNYYSDIKKQYVDIELPADIFNFLQTYLPEKRHDIVLEIEKNDAIRNHITNNKEKTNLIEDMDTQNFENKIKKLKLMYENDILTEEEFLIEKKRLLEQL